MFLLKRILKVIITWLAVVFITFSVFLIANPNLAASVLRSNNIYTTNSAILSEKAKLGLNQPIVVQFWRWLVKFIRGDFGRSYAQHDSVLNLILQALPYTITLTILTVILIALVVYGYSLILIKYEDRLVEKWLRIIILGISSIPSFWLGLILLIIFAVNLNMFGLSTRFGDPTSFVLPVVTMSALYIGSYLRIIRVEVLDNKKRAYIRYYRYQGFDSKYISKMIVRNSMSSVLISVGISLAKLLAGSAVVETLFNCPGMGYLCVNAIINRDFPVIQGYVAIMALIFLVLNEIIQYLNRKYVLARGWYEN
jgi:nickel transport system permease protein